MLDVDELLERHRKQYEKERTIACPHCGYKSDEPEDYYDFISYHGEDGPQETNCQECGRDFYVEEYVERTWTVGIAVDSRGSLVEAK